MDGFEFIFRPSAWFTLPRILGMAISTANLSSSVCDHRKKENLLVHVGGRGHMGHFGMYLG